MENGKGIDDSNDEDGSHGPGDWARARVSDERRRSADAGQGRRLHAPFAPAGSDRRKPSYSHLASPSADENHSVPPRLSPPSRQPSPLPHSSTLLLPPSSSTASGMTATSSPPPSVVPTATAPATAVSDDESDPSLSPSQITSLLLCPCCSPPAPLVAPTTLRCGHTVCARHVLSPTDASAPEPADGPSQTTEKSSEQRRTQSSTTCPIPACTQGISATSRALRPNIPPGSSVTYTPAPEEDLTPDDTPTSGPVESRVDVTVAKILALVERAEREIAEEEARRSYGFVPTLDRQDGEHTDDEDDRAASATEANVNAAAIGPPHSDTSPNTTIGRGTAHVRHRPRPNHASSDRPRKRRRRLAEHPPSAAIPPPSNDLQPARARFEKELMVELSCEICFVLLYQPVTAPCQHTFCAKCLQRSLDYSLNCPLCRQELPGFVYFQDHPQNKLLLSIILRAFPGHYRDRAETIEAEERDSRLDTPIFICLLSFPGIPTYLHFFEPRYRLMLRRCLESPTHRFGMIMPPRAGQASQTEYGTMLEIRSVQMLADGRSMVETWGIHRFRILERGTLDGYMVGRVERIDDYEEELDDSTDDTDYTISHDVTTENAVVPSSSSSRPRGALAAMTSTVRRVARGGSSYMPMPRPRPPSNEELMETCKAFLAQMRAGTAPWVVQRLNNTYGPMPEDASSFSFWVALVLPIDEHEKAKLLPIKSPRLRLKLITHWIEELNSNWWFSSGCVIL